MMMNRLFWFKRFSLIFPNQGRTLRFRFDNEYTNWLISLDIVIVDTKIFYLLFVIESKVTKVTV